MISRSEVEAPLVYTTMLNMVDLTSRGMLLVIGLVSSHPTKEQALEAKLFFLQTPERVDRLGRPSCPNCDSLEEWDEKPTTAETEDI